MKVIRFTTGLTTTMTGGERVRFEPNKHYICTEDFAREFSLVHGQHLIEAEFSLDQFLKPYKEQDLADKTLFCFRSAGIGDLMAMMVPIRILKELYPTCKIIIGSSRTYRQMFESDPAVDEFHGLPYPLDILLKSDYSMQFQGLVEGGSPEAMMTNIYDLFLNAFGMKDVSNEDKLPKLYIPDELNYEFGITMEGKGLREKRPVAGIQLQASSPLRAYPLQYFKELITKLNSQGILTIVIGEPHVSQIIIQYGLCDEKMSYDFAQHCLTLDHLFAIINQCDFLIGPDTSGTHIAGALGKPMVGIYGPIPSELRIKYFKNAVGVDCKTACHPCFLHGHRPCRYTLQDGISPCMKLATPDKVLKAINDEVLPLFGITEHKTQPPKLLDMPVDERRAIVTLAIGDQAQDMLKVAQPSFEYYAKKVNADLIIIDGIKITENMENAKFPNLEKFQIKEMLDNYDRIMYLDVDVLINPDCPDIFNIVPPDKVGVVPDCSDGKWGNINRFKEIVAAQDALGDAHWESGYFNTGVLVFSKQHKGLFDNPENREKMQSQYRDQTLVNFNFHKNGYELFVLDRIYNGMEINGFSSRTDNPNKTQAMIMHFAHEGNKVEQMSKTARGLIPVPKFNKEDVQEIASG